MNNIILGIDSSKKTFDVALLNNHKVNTKKFSNDSKGFSTLKQWLVSKSIHDAHACMKQLVVMKFHLLSTFMAIILKLV